MQPLSIFAGIVASNPKPNKLVAALCAATNLLGFKEKFIF
jgi:hypothetical protein